MHSNKNNRIELLSPAKDLECGIAAIDNGADAVYIGGPGFGARKNAGNSLDDIAELIVYAHLYNVKVYITINTLLYDGEIEAANKLIHDVYNLGADAVIIQDMGLLETNLPPIPVHASTQTDNRTAAKVKFLEEVGFDQVVLARELSLQQIEEIRKQTTVPLEYFIHGALCVSYSGQCYMSESINKRSANRGECAQPCRLKYSLKDKDGNILYKDKHLLSLKDLNLEDSLEELIDAGISSFKIEGRLKDKDYVANVTAYYRKKLDKIIEGRNDIERASSGYCNHSFDANVSKSFNRGFSSYFINGRQKGVWAIDSPKSLGEKIGRVKSVGKDNFILDSQIKINNGDGLCFFTSNKILTGFKVSRAEGTKIYPNKMNSIRSGMIIFRNYDNEFINKLNNKKSERKIEVKIDFTQDGESFRLSMTDEDNIKTALQINELSHSPATNPERAFEMIRAQISKLGNTPFVPTDVNINLRQNLFFQARDINAIRRDLISKHEENRLASYKRKERIISPNNIKFPDSEPGYLANIINEKAKQFYQRHGVMKIEQGYELNHKKGAELMRTKHCLLYLDNRCLLEHPEARELLPLTLFNSKDNYSLEFDCKNCEMVVKKIKD